MLYLPFGSFPFASAADFTALLYNFRTRFMRRRTVPSLQRKSHERDYRADGSKRMYIVTFREALYIPAFVRITNGCHSLSSLFYMHIVAPVREFNEI